MNKFFFILSILFCLAHGQSMAQKAGDTLWTHITDINPNTWSEIHNIKVQSDGKIVAAGFTLKSKKVIALGRYVENVLDSSFGINGIVTTYLDSGDAEANTLELQPDGKIVVAGSYKKGTGSDYMLARYLQDGTLDSSFGLNGLVLTDIIAGSKDEAFAITIQPDGRIVAAGKSDTSLSLCRYKADGTLDSSFDFDGKLIITASGATCMKLQSDGKILACTGNKIIRLLPDGGIDASFGTNGVAALTGNLVSMTIQNDGKILLSGSGNQSFLVERLDTAGVHDSTFGKKGIVNTSGFSQLDHYMIATSVCVQDDRRILACGWLYYTQSVIRCFALARYQGNGALDSSFGNLGKVTTPWPADFNYSISKSATITKNNEVVLAGYSLNSSNHYRWTMISYNLGPKLAVPITKALNNQIIVAPNPAGDFVHLKLTQLQIGTWNLSLCDLSGKTFYSESIVVRNNTLDKSLSLVGLPAAMYLIYLENGNSKMVAKLTKSW